MYIKIINYTEPRPSKKFASVQPAGEELRFSMWTVLTQWFTQYAVTTTWGVSFSRKQGSPEF